MMEILSQSQPDVLGVRISGTLTHEDYEKLEPELRLRADSREHFDVLVELADVEGLEPAAIQDDLRFTREFSDDIGRMAVVSDDPMWERLSEYLGKPLGDLMGIDVKHFDTADVAWEWIRSN